MIVEFTLSKGELSLSGADPTSPSWKTWTFDSWRNQAWVLKKSPRF